MELTILGSGLFTQNLALLQLGLTLEELGPTLVPLCLEVTGLIAGAIQLRLSLLEFGFGFLQLVLALLKFSGELLLGGQHGGGDMLGDFEELSASLL